MPMGRTSVSTHKPLLAFYGDDFTGSTDVLEALACAGLNAVLFLRPPTPGDLSRFGKLDAFGIAGASRTMSPREMGRELPRAFEALKQSGARIVHYKICSTFDSSPKVGSIGRAIDLGQKVFQSNFVPLLVGAPSLGRYCVFGNLFARSGLDTEPFRLDRHPTMSCHPATPMMEADLRLHLQEQTRKRIGLVNVLGLERHGGAQALECALSEGAEIILFDVLRDEHLEAIGDLLHAHGQSAAQIFAVGSSGLEYALTSAWRKSGVLPPPPPIKDTPSTNGIVVVSGSCSPVTNRQIARALASGFAEVALDTVKLANPRTRTDAIQRAMADAQPFITKNRNVIFHTARGPKDPRLAKTRKALLSLRAGSAEVLGAALGELLLAALERTGARRAAVTGGDTSSFVARALGAQALEYFAPMTPGSPLCTIHADSPLVNGCQIVFKGGQNGHDDFFLTVLNGQSAPARQTARMK